METSEMQLLERWHRYGDAEAFTSIVTSHGDMVYATCRRVLHDPVEAEDAAQECFESLMRNGASVRKSLAGWLHTTAVHRCLDRIKSEKRRRAREERHVTQTAVHPKSGTDELLSYVDEAIASLPPDLRIPLVLRYLEGQTQERIATHLAIAEPTVRYRVNRALERVRDQLKRRGVIVTIAMLTVAFERSAAAAPPTMIAHLGKLAIAGVPKAPTTALGRLLASGQSIVNKTVVVGFAALCIIGAGTWAWTAHHAADNAGIRESKGIAAPPLASATTVAMAPGGGQTSSASTAQASSPAPEPPAPVPDDGAALAACQNNLKQLGLVLQMTGKESRGRFPVPGPRLGYLALPQEAVYPNYLTDPKILICPAAQPPRSELFRVVPDKSNALLFFKGSSYWYLNYALPTEEDGLAFVAAYKKHLDTPGGATAILPGEIPVPNVEGRTLRLLREGIERFYVKDSGSAVEAALVRSGIPVLVERLGSHQGGAHVYYLDGHIEFLKYPSKYPMSVAFISALQSLDARLGSIVTPTKEDSAPASANALQAARTIVGTVTDDVGNRVPGAEIYIATGAHGLQDPKQTGQARAAQSGADGTFTINNPPIDAVQPDTIALCALHPLYSVATITATLERDKATRVTIALVKGGTVHGRVTCGAAVLAHGNATLQVIDIGRYTSSIAFDPDGSYTFKNVSPGPVNVQVSAKVDEKSSRSTISPAVVETGKTTEVDFDFPPLVTSLSGFVTMEEKPATGGYVVATVTSPVGDEEFFARIGSDGTYRFDALPEGSAALLVHALAAGKSAEASVDVVIPAHDALQKDIACATPASVHGTVTGGLTDGANMTGVAALRGEITIPPSFSPELYAQLRGLAVTSIRVASNGTYTLPQTLAPGVYTVIAYTRPGQDAASISQIRFAASVITITDGKSLTLDFTIH